MKERVNEHWLYLYIMTLEIYNYGRETFFRPFQFPKICYPLCFYPGRVLFQISWDIQRENLIVLKGGLSGLDQLR